MSDFWKSWVAPFLRILGLLGAFALLCYLVSLGTCGNTNSFCQGQANCIQVEQCHSRDFAEKSKCFYHCKHHWSQYLE